MQVVGLLATFRRLTKHYLTCLRGAFPPVDLRAVCLVRAILFGELVGLVVVVACQSGLLCYFG